MGVPTLKCPLDLWIYQELLHDIRPDLVIETGTHSGGSALFLAHLMDILGRGEVWTIDLHVYPDRPNHPRIRYFQGSSTDPKLLPAALKTRPADETRMVILDSDHSQAHVTRELALYAPHVSPGSYLIVEDTNVNGHPVYPEFGPGPAEAVQTFLATHPDFSVDTQCEKLLLSFNPGGYLRRQPA
ncbi:hypothetical protein CKO35_04010 [Ectothiorhodospira shaposhnikovii]|nr:hypothetical protein [Ectothiorhodospira shaposhnikovii]